MKIKKYTNGAWTDLDKPVKKYDTYTDETTTLPLTIEASTTDAIENYQVYGTSEGAGVQTENLVDVEQWLDDRGATYTFSDGTYTIDAQPNLYSSPWYFSQENIVVSFKGKISNVTATSTRIDAINADGTLAQRYVLLAGQTYQTENISCAGFRMDWSAIGKIALSRFMVVKGSTVPTTFIPFGYKIPILLTDGTSTSNYDLFIGDSKLYEDEYVDYGEQKVYKRTENLFDKNAKDTNNGYVRWHVIISTGAVIQDSSWDVTEYINVKPSTVYTASNCVGVTASICFYDTNKEYISGITYSLPKPGGYGTLTFTTPNNCAYARTCVLTVNQSGAGYEFERNVDVFMITEGSTAPSSYIPYLQPTDPPAPLPPIPTYKGENNLSVDTTVQPEKVAVEYEGWKGVGDVEKYQNGEWSDNNGT